jgi:hypothetical protein
VFFHVARMLLILLGAIALTLMIFEKSFLFHPEREHAAPPTAVGLRHEDILFRTRDGVRLHGWFLPHDRPLATVLFLHGNAGNISHRLPKARLLHELGMHVFLVDYRGYGRSQGRPSEAGTYRDAQAAWEALIARRDVDRSRIVCFGESLGGAVAIDLATRAPCRALVIESSFTSLPDLVSDLFPALPLRWLVSTRYDSLRKLAAVRVPVLFMHGAQDDLVPLHHSHRLFAAAREPKDLFEVPAAGHNDVHVAAGKRWPERIEAFVRNALRYQPVAM